MSYPSYHNAPRCQQCGASLALNDPRCTNCGYPNTLRPESSTPQKQPSTVEPWNQTVQSGAYEQNPPINQPGQRQNEGLLKRYPAQNEQRNHYIPQAAPRPIPPPTPSNTISPQVGPQTGVPRSAASAQQMPGNWNGYQQVPGQQPNSSNYAQNMSRPSTSSTGPTTPPISFRTPSQQVPPPAYIQGPHAFYQEPKRRRFQIGRIVSVLVLLLVVIGGSLLTYTFLFSHKNSQQAASSTVSTHNPSAPLPTQQGAPLFQDEFTNNTNGWSIQSYPGEFSVALGNGALKLENDNNKLLWELIPGDKQYGNFQLSVDAVLSKGSQENGYGVYIRSALSQNASITAFYRFELYGDGSFALFKGTTDANGAVTTPRLIDYTNSSAIQKQGSLNHITISAKGSSLQFIVNGQTLGTVTDGTYTSGSIALFVSNLQKAQPGAIATFSHLAIYAAQK